MFDLGLELAKLREEKGYTQLQVANKLQVTTCTVSRWENNYKKPSVDKLISLSVLYGVTLNRLTGIEVEKSVSVDGLTKQQETIINNLLLEFRDKHTRYNNTGLTKRQQEILNQLLVEFNS